VLDNHSGANEPWLRSGFEWDTTSNVQLKSQVYVYNAQRHWFNNEINSFIDDLASPNFGQVYRERLSVDHDQKLYGNVTDLTVNTEVAGFDNRFVATVAASSLQFNVFQDDFFNNDIVNLVNPDRGLYGTQQTKNFYTHVDNVSLSLEDRIKLTSNFALIGGIRVEEIKLARTAFDVKGALRDGYPFSTTFTPVTGRVGYTWEALPGMTFYSQYATAADPTVVNIFNLRPTTPLLLTTSRIYETGLKLLSSDKKAEFTVSAFDIERKNVYVPESGILFNVAGKIASKGFEMAGVAASSVTHSSVPGAYELPFAAKQYAGAGFDGVACLGVVIRGETDHFDFVCAESARGIQQVQLETGMPCAFGVITCDNMEQALARAGGGKRDQGRNSALTVARMALLKRRLG